MIRLMFFVFTFLSLSAPSIAQDKPERIAIIKADDMRKVTPKWERFFALSKEKSVKVSVGIICNSLNGAKKEYINWLRDNNSSGWLEFWNHGWDHKRWLTDENEKVSEFNGTGYKHQKKHFNDSQQIMQRIFGAETIAFGSPYNAIDSTTVSVMNEAAELQLFFSYRHIDHLNKVMALMRFRGEHDGTGKPNFEKFKAEYLDKKDVSFSAIQFHPNMFDGEHFGEYAKILDFLIDEGWTFMLPAQYVSFVDQSQKKNKTRN